MSTVPSRADAFVAAHLAEARSVADRLVPLLDRPDAFVAALEKGLRDLADPAYLDELRRMTPGQLVALGVRTPLTRLIHTNVRRICRGRPDIALWVAERVEREPYLEVRAIACTLLRVSLDDDPERSWQLLRRMARNANNWIAVDTLAGVAALGILLEPFRWAELEQLVYVASPWQRRLVGSTIASLPFEVVPEDRPRLADGPALSLLEQLIGDADDNVQKALAWALRSWIRVDPTGVDRFLDAQAARAAADGDGHRAHVVRDALPALDPGQARRLRTLRAGVRRVPRTPSTSSASRAAIAFAELIAAGRTTAVTRLVPQTAPTNGARTDLLTDEPERSLAE